MEEGSKYEEKPEQTDYTDVVESEEGTEIAILQDLSRMVWKKRTISSLNLRSNGERHKNKLLMNNL